MIDYLGFIQSESARFESAIRSADLGADVPSCPEWTVADLAWHLAEVQHFWSSIVEGLLDDPEDVEELDRPADEELADLFAAQSQRLVAALEGADPQAACWTWSSDQTVGFVIRRQAHEAAIHRVDAELGARLPITPLDAHLAEDGILELFQHMIAGPLPEWATYTPGDTVVAVAVPSGRTWTARFGRFRGTSPRTGTDYDLEALAEDPSATPDAIIRGPADALDRWMWGRGDLGDLTVEGDRAIAERLRANVAETTQ